MCLSQCQVSGNVPFSLSGAAAATPQASEGVCSNDYMIFPGGYSLPVTTPTNLRDRYCGTLLAQTTAPTVGNPPAVAQTICSKINSIEVHFRKNVVFNFANGAGTVKPFRLFYRTNGDETVTPTTDPDPALGNQGFCLTFEQTIN